MPVDEASNAAFAAGFPFDLKYYIIVVGVAPLPAVFPAQDPFVGLIAGRCDHDMAERFIMFDFQCGRNVVAKLQIKKILCPPVSLGGQPVAVKAAHTFNTLRTTQMVGFDKFIPGQHRTAFAAD